MLKYKSRKKALNTKGRKILNITDLVINVGILFIMMIPGLILKKFKMVGADFGKGISNLVLYIAQPSLIVYAYLSCESEFSEIWLPCVLTFAISMLIHFIFSAVAFAFFRREPESKRKMLRLVTIFSNAAFMGIPLIQSILSPEAAIYASIYNITFNLFLWTLGVHLCTRRSGEDMDGDNDSDIVDELLSAKHHMKKEVSIKKVLLHPVTIASAVGVILLILGINVTVLESNSLGIISDSLEMLKSLVAPLSMVVIGLRLAELKLDGVLTDVGMYIFLALRHLVLPLTSAAVMWLLTLIGVPIDEVTRTVIIILAATPSATSATMFAEKYDCDAAYTSRLVLISTILSIGTMPFVLYVANLMFK